MVGAIVLLASSGASAEENGEPAQWVAVLKLVLGLLLLALAVHMWRGRPRGDAQPALPKWMKTIDTFTTGRSVAMGVALSGINPKNLVMAVAAGAAIAQTGIPAGEQAIALAVFVVIGTLGPGCRWASTSRWAPARSSSSASCATGWAATTRRSWPCSRW